LKSSAALSFVLCLGTGIARTGGHAPVPTANEYRQRARDCLLLATTANDFYAREALISLAADFEKMADGLQRRSINPPDRE
jgi:hypothetical protein